MAAPESFHRSILAAEGSSDTDVSPKGARFSSQVTDATAARPGYGIRPAASRTAAEYNRVGREYRDALYDDLGGDVTLAAAAYNAGPGAVQKYGGVPPYRETQNYVRKVQASMRKEPKGLSSEEEKWLAENDPDYATYAKAPEQIQPEQIQPEQTQGGLSPEEEKWLSENDPEYSSYTQTPEQPKEPLPERTSREYASDIGTTAQKGVIGALQGLRGLADIPAGGRIGKAMDEAGYDLGRMQKELEAQYSPQQQAENKALQDASGVADNLKAAWEHPTAVAAMVGESIPSIYAGGIIGKAAKAAGVAGEFLAAGIGEGAITAGSTEEQVRSQAEDKLLSAKGAIASIGAGVGTGVLGRYGSELVTKMGGIDPTLMFMGGARKAASEAVGEGAKTPGFFKAALTSAFGEGILEEAPQSAQEQMWQNYATDKPLLEGVKDAAIKGAITGAVMGTGAQSISSLTSKKEEVAPTDQAGLSEAAREQIEIAKANQAQRGETVSKVAESKQPEEVILKSWGIPEKSKLYKDLKSQDLFTPEGMAKVNAIIEAASTSRHGDKLLAGFDHAVYAQHTEKINASIPKAAEAAEVVTPKAKAAEAAEVVTPKAKAAEAEEVVTPKAKAAEAAEVVTPEAEAAEEVVTPEAEAAEEVVTPPTKRVPKVKPVAAVKPVAPEEVAIVKPVVQAKPKSRGEQVTALKESVFEPSDENMSVLKSHTKNKNALALAATGTATVGEVHGLLKGKESINFMGDLADRQVKTPIAAGLKVEPITRAPKEKPISNRAVLKEYQDQARAGTFNLKDPKIQELDRKLKATDLGMHTMLHNIHDRAKKENALRAEAEETKQLKERVAKQVAEKNKQKPSNVVDINRAKENRLAIIEAAAKDVQHSVAPTSATTRHTAASLSKNLSPEMKRLIASGKAVIHDTQASLPGKNHPANVQGMTTKEGVTHYVANKLTPETLAKVALHEVGVHAGMEKMLGKALWEDTKQQALTNKGKEFDAARAAIPEDTPEQLRAEEALAYLVEHSPQLSIIRRLVATVRNFLRSTVGNITLTEADARQLAVKALRRESKTAERTVREEAAYAIAPANASPEDRAVIDNINTRTAAYEAKLAKNPTPKMGRFRRTINKIQNLTMDDSATFINESSRRLKDLGLPFSMSKDLMLSISKSQAWHDTGLAAAAIKLGKLVYKPNELKFVAIEDVNNLETVDAKVKAIGEKYSKDPALMKTLFNEIMIARRIIDIRKQADAIRKTAAGLSPSLKDRYLNKPSTIEKLELADKMHYTVAETDQIMKSLAAMPELLAKDGPIEMWNKVRVNAINTLVDTGYWTKDKAEAYIDNAAYTPFYRDMTADQQNIYMEDMQTNSIKGASGLLGHRKEHKIVGSERQVKDVIENMEQWLASAYTKAIKNHKAVQMVNFMQDYMPKGSIERLASDADHTGGFYVFRDGIKEWYRTEDPLFTHAFVGMPATIRLAFLKPAAVPARILRDFIVLNPLFTAAQLPQDTFAAMYTSNLKYPLMLPAEVAKEFTKTLLGRSSAAKHLYRRGAAGIMEYSDMAVRRDLELSMGIDRSSIPKTALEKAKKSGGKLKRSLERFAMIGDNAVRQAIYNRTMKEMGGGLEAEKIAVERAFEVINFRKRGVSTGIDMLRQTVPFFGAYLQVQNVALKTLSGTGIAPIERKQALATLAMTTAQVIALSLAYNALIGGDEELEDVDPKLKDKRLYIPFTNKSVFIPLRPDVFLMPHIFMTHIFNALGKGDGKENPEMAKRYIYDALVQSIPTISALPTLIKAPLENITNHDFFTGRDIVGIGLEGRNPAEQWTPTTTEVSKQLGALTSDLPAALQVSPVKVDHFIRGFAGSAGVAVLSIVDAALRQGMGIPSTDTSWQESIRKFPGASSFIASDKGSKSLSEYYVVQNESNRAFNSLKTYETQPEKYEAYLKTHEALVDPAVRSELERISQTLADIREAEVEIRSLPNSEMSSAEKQAQLKELENAKKETASSMRDVEDAVFGK